MLSPLDDYPVHQTSDPILVVGTSDRNFYDRYYFNLFHKDRTLMLTAGLGQYPNLGVTDAFVAVTLDGRQHVVRASRELGLDRRDTTVGPIAVEVIEGLRRVRFRVAESEGPIELDVEWTPAIPAFLEVRHLDRQGPRARTDTSRFCQTGCWSGRLRVGTREFDVGPDDWWGGRDRSWGVRPVGEPEPSGRTWDDGPVGFLWLYSTMQFPDYSIMLILQEDGGGGRRLEQAVRLWPEATGRKPEPLGRVDHELHFVDGTRLLERAELTFSRHDAPTLRVAATPVGASYLSLGTGYGYEQGWRHGMYQGPDLVVEHLEYDLADPDVQAAMYGLVDNLARFEIDGVVGHGLLENAFLGPVARYGFGSRRSTGK